MPREGVRCLRPFHDLRRTLAAGRSPGQRRCTSLSVAVPVPSSARRANDRGLTVTFAARTASAETSAACPSSPPREPDAASSPAPAA